MRLTMKIAINKLSVYFELSPRAWKRYVELSGKDLHFLDDETYQEIDIKSDNNHRYILLDARYYNENAESVKFEPERNDPALIQTLEELGALANTDWSEFKIIEIPDDVNWHVVKDYDNDFEYIEEIHRIWS